MCTCEVCMCVCQKCVILSSQKQGRIFRDITLPGVSPSERHAIYVSMVTTLLWLHSVDWRAVGLEEFGAKGDYSKRQVSSLCT